jgi:hypothetical protein
LARILTIARDRGTQEIREEISEKIRSSAHIEFNTQDYPNEDNIKKRIKYF